MIWYCQRDRKLNLGITITIHSFTEVQQASCCWLSRSGLNIAKKAEKYLFHLSFCLTRIMQSGSNLENINRKHVITMPWALFTLSIFNICWCQIFHNQNQNNTSFFFLKSCKKKNYWTLHLYFANVIARCCFVMLRTIFRLSLTAGLKVVTKFVIHWLFYDYILCFRKIQKYFKWVQNTL